MSRGRSLFFKTLILRVDTSEISSKIDHNNRDPIDQNGANGGVYINATHYKSN